MAETDGPLKAPARAHWCGFQVLQELPGLLEGRSIACCREPVVGRRQEYCTKVHRRLFPTPLERLIHVCQGLEDRDGLRRFDLIPWTSMDMMGERRYVPMVWGIVRPPFEAASTILPMDPIRERLHHARGHHNKFKRFEDIPSS